MDEGSLDWLMARQREYDKRMTGAALLDPTGPQMFLEHRRVVAQIDLLPISLRGRLTPTAAPAQTEPSTDAAPPTASTGRLPQRGS